MKLQGAPPGPGFSPALKCCSATPPHRAPPRSAASAQHKYHEVFIHSGGLGTLKAWLEPYADGSLPNVRIRLAVLKLCKVRAHCAVGAA